MNKKLVNRKEVKHWLGNSYEEWIHDCIYRLMNEEIKPLFDIASIITVLGALAELLPPLAALATLIWSIIRIYETKTIQSIINKKKNKN